MRDKQQCVRFGEENIQGVVLQAFVEHNKAQPDLPILVDCNKHKTKYLVVSV